MTDDHRKVPIYDGAEHVCAGCINSLGYNVAWDQAEKVGHVIPSYDELDDRIREAFESVPDMMGGLRAVYQLGRGEKEDAP
ncbi:hypothetical protein [Microbacterium sp. No. 7]|uniref:hypothetical protein n=1 Tax=Microbacterium sp. No. 7 TaxID=1714373 RepID=UPI0006CFF23A|nr:hypothetical protein [Microbacterium sp. No. 7]ALJ19548.1 hypothetical protein AOA12_06345 [Microbacterium sp. No. 7]